jgi:hypothetical protein
MGLAKTWMRYGVSFDHGCRRRASTCLCHTLHHTATASSRFVDGTAAPKIFRGLADKRCGAAPIRPRCGGLAGVLGLTPLGQGFAGIHGWVDATLIPGFPPCPTLGRGPQPGAVDEVECRLINSLANQRPGQAIQRRELAGQKNTHQNTYLTEVETNLSPAFYIARSTMLYHRCHSRHTCPQGSCCSGVIRAANHPLSPLRRPLMIYEFVSIHCSTMARVESSHGC